MGNKESGLLDGLILGGLIGVAVGLILAPAAGDKTREMIKERLSQLGLDGMIDRFSEALEAGKEEAVKATKEVEM
ncbi:MAG: YtxH domain-containing protein [bacterium]